MAVFMQGCRAEAGQRQVWRGRCRVGCEEVGVGMDRARAVGRCECGAGRGRAG